MDKKTHDKLNQRNLFCSRKALKKLKLIKFQLLSAAVGVALGGGGEGLFSNTLKCLRHEPRLLTSEQ